MNSCIYCTGELKILNRNTGSMRNRRTRYFSYCPKCKAKGPLKKSEEEVIAACTTFSVDWPADFLYELEVCLDPYKPTDPAYWSILADRCKYRGHLIEMKRVVYRDAE